MRRTVAALLAATLATACSAGASTPSDPRITVLAAASLTEAFEDLGRSTAVTFSFAGSQELVAQVEAGAPVDVVATADPDAMDRLARAGLVDTPRTFAGNRLAIAVGPGNPERIRGLTDLVRDGLTVVLADPAVPAGQYARQVLERAGVRVRPVSLELDVKAVARKVASGEADAGIVYATDVAAGSSVAIPDASNVVATYPVAVARTSANRGAAEAFVELLLGQTGRDTLSSHGFLLP
ncbi:MAG: molybdate ABC transporter substrate-binding protein [Actinomycetota bacterium]|nr:molybdate ABC transporter substrate-binding protein [Actinomycetota bacterium]